MLSDATLILSLLVLAIGLYLIHPGLVLVAVGAAGLAGTTRN